MVYQIVWTPKAVESFTANMDYLERDWSSKEVTRSIEILEKKLSVLSQHPDIGVFKDKANPEIKHTVLNRQISLIYRVNSEQHRIELLLFWNNYQHPSKLKYE